MSDKLRTLSDAIRLGATFRPQCHGALYGIVNDCDGNLVIATCALGAAIEAVCGFNEDTHSPNGSIHDLAHRFPGCSEQFMDVFKWNDGSEKLTREQIADRLDERMGRK